MNTQINRTGKCDTQSMLCSEQQKSKKKKKKLCHAHCTVINVKGRFMRAITRQACNGQHMCLSIMVLVMASWAIYILKVACSILFSLLITCHDSLFVVADIKKISVMVHQIFKGKKADKEARLQKHAVLLNQSIYIIEKTKCHFLISTPMPIAELVFA